MAQRLGHAVARRVLCGVVSQKQDSTCPQLGGAEQMFAGLPLHFTGAQQCGLFREMVTSRHVGHDPTQLSKSGLETLAYLSMQAVLHGINQHIQPCMLEPHPFQTGIA